MLNKKLQRFWRDEAGATAIEYALLAGLIGAVCVSVFFLTGGEVLNMFGYISSQVVSAVSGS